ncbi:MAG: hypothetical protein SFU27_05340 [Thermonemataceae bacterium]|nr:hypothetical protein [Thermonemataceae bacterium]
MSDKHGNARKGLMANTALLVGAGVLLAVTSIAEITTGSKALGIISLVVGAGGALPNVLGAWKSFSNLEYGETMKKGVIAWLVPTGMALLNLAF